MDGGVGELVQVHIHARKPHHIGRDVIADEVLGQALLLVRGEGWVLVLIQDVLVSRDEEASRAAGRV